DRVATVGSGVHVRADIAVRGAGGGVVGREVRVDVRGPLGRLDVDEPAAGRQFQAPVHRVPLVVVAGDVDATDRVPGGPGGGDRGQCFGRRRDRGEDGGEAGSHGGGCPDGAGEQRQPQHDGPTPAWRGHHPPHPHRPSVPDARNVVLTSVTQCPTLVP